MYPSYGISLGCVMSVRVCCLPLVRRRRPRSAIALGQLCANVCGSIKRHQCTPYEASEQVGVSLDAAEKKKGSADGLKVTKRRCSSSVLPCCLSNKSQVFRWLQQWRAFSPRPSKTTAPTSSRPSDHLPNAKGVWLMEDAGLEALAWSRCDCDSSPTAMQKGNLVGQPSTT